MMDLRLLRRELKPKGNGQQRLIVYVNYIELFADAS
tara:strand:+ start:133 stop:240 length:108 start_codon:yes stop_codon:yes gene_type:complete